MSKLLENLMNKAEETAKIEKQEKIETQPTHIEQFIKAKEEGKDFKVTFDIADQDGNLSAEINGITLVLTTETFKKEAKYYRPRLRASFLAMEINVKVDSVDIENKIVYLESFKEGRKTSTQSALIRELIAMVDKQKSLPEDKRTPIKLYGRISKIAGDGSRAAVDLLNRNIRGSISVTHWEKTYTRTLNSVVNVGDMVEFAVTNYTTYTTEEGAKGTIFKLDRSCIAEDLWVKLPNYDEGSVVVVRCIEDKEARNYAWGDNPRYPGIEIMLRKNENIVLKPGMYYKAKVKKLDKEKHIFKCVPFAIANPSEDMISL